MAVTPSTAILPQTPYSKTAVMTVAETAFQAPTNAVDLLTQAENVNGARISKLIAIARAANAAANTIALYERSGSTYTLIDTQSLPIGTPSATVVAPKVDFGATEDSPIYVKAGVGLAVSLGTAIANGVVAKLEGGLY